MRYLNLYQGDLKMFRKHWKLICLMAVACLAVCIGAVATMQAVNGEREVSIEEVPPAVKAAILAEAEGGTIGEIEVETQDGKTVYEAEAIIDGREIEIEVAADGTLLSKETEDDEDEQDDDDDEEEEGISLEEVPEAVKATVLKEAAGAEIEELVRETEDAQIVYEAEFVVAGQTVEIEVAPDGMLLEREIDDDEDDDDD